LLDLNLEDKIKVKPQLIGLILSDLIHLDKLVSTTEIQSSLIVISINNDDHFEEIIIEKDYLIKNIIFKSNNNLITQNLYIYISLFLNISFNEELIRQRIIDFNSFKTNNITEIEGYLTNIENKITINPLVEEENIQLQSSVDQLKLKANEGLNPEEATKLDRLREVKGKIKVIQEEIDFYQNEKKTKEEINNNLKGLENQKINIGQMLESVKLLITSREDLKKELIKFGPIAQDDNLALKVQFLKEEHKNKMMNLLSNVKSKIKNNGDELLNRNPESLYGKSIIILLCFQLLLTVLVYVLSLENRVLFLGILSFLILILIFFLTNTFKTRDTVLIKTKQHSEKIIFQDITIDKDNDEKRNKFFVSAAWISALKSEFSIASQTIKSRLNNKSYEEIEMDLQRIEKEIATLNNKMLDLTKKSLTSEEYYKKRRELDILKIEKENLEYTVSSNNQNIENEIEKANEKLNTNRSKTQKIKLLIVSLPIFILNLNLATDPIKTGIQSLILKRSLLMFQSE